jgi:hypothetical protein
MFALLGLSMPGFFIGLVLVIIFGVELGWLPVLGKGQSAFVVTRPQVAFWFQDWQYLAMPVFAPGWFFSGAMLHHLLEYAGDYRQRLYQARAPEGHSRMGGDSQTRLKNSLDSHPDAGRTELARDDQRGGGGRSRL